VVVYFLGHEADRGDQGTKGFKVGNWWRSHSWLARQWKSSFYCSWRLGILSFLKVNYEILLVGNLSSGQST